jgi:hypothetical protein
VADHLRTGQGPPGVFAFDVTSDPDELDLSTVTGAVLLVLRPDQIQAIWTATIVDQAPGALALEHALAVGDLPIEGSYSEAARQQQEISVLLVTTILESLRGRSEELSAQAEEEFAALRRAQERAMRLRRPTREVEHAHKRLLRTMDRLRALPPRH